MSTMKQLVAQVGHRRGTIPVSELKTFGKILIGSRDDGWWFKFTIGAGGGRVVFEATEDTISECSEVISQKLYDFLGV